MVVADPQRLPAARDWFTDARGSDRALRVTSHVDDGLVVFSIWRDDRCVSSFQLSVPDLPQMISVLATALGEAARPTAPADLSNAQSA